MILDSNKSVLIILDPQKGFTNTVGTIAKTYGFEELEEVQKTVRELNMFISQLDSKQQILFIRSEYKKGQFTNKDLDKPLANLCIKDSVDCEWSEGLKIPKNAKIITKNHTDATTEGDYLTYLEYKLGQGYTDLYFAGFMTSTCVKQTILSTENFFYKKFNYNLIKQLAASRSSYYKERLKNIYDELILSGCKIV